MRVGSPRRKSNGTGTTLVVAQQATRRQIGRIGFWVEQRFSAALKLGQEAALAGFCCRPEGLPTQGFQGTVGED
jgi:hypothetical protein